jgi:hypothetical protein
MTVTGHIHVVVPTVLDEINWNVTGVVLCTVLAPVLLMARRNMKINRPAHNSHRHRLNDHWGLIDQLRNNRAGNDNPDNAWPHEMRDYLSSF